MYGLSRIATKAKRIYKVECVVLTKPATKGAIVRPRLFCPSLQLATTLVAVPVGLVLGS